MHDWNGELAADEERGTFAAHCNEVWLCQQSDVTIFAKCLQVHLKVCASDASKERGGARHWVVAVHELRIADRRTRPWLNVYGLEGRAARRLHPTEHTVAADQCTRSKFTQGSATCLCDANLELHLLNACDPRDIHPAKSGGCHKVSYLYGGGHIGH